MVWGSIPDRGKIFFLAHKGPEQLWGPSSLLLSGYQDSFSLGLRHLGLEVDH